MPPSPANLNPDEARVLKLNSMPETRRNYYFLGNAILLWFSLPTIGSYVASACENSSIPLSSMICHVVGSTHGYNTYNMFWGLFLVFGFGVPFILLSLLSLRFAIFWIKWMKNKNQVISTVLTTPIIALDFFLSFLWIVPVCLLFYTIVGPRPKSAPETHPITQIETIPINWNDKN